MIRKIKAVVNKLDINEIIIQSENFFFESIPTYRILKNCEENKEYIFETILDINEWNISLYLFYDNFERNMFLNLKKVSKLGSKSALKILQNADAENIATMISANDINGLSKLPGVGKKTAERIANELKNIFDSFVTTGNNSKLNDALDALEALGFERNKIYKVLKEMNIENLSLENIITQALKKL
ncbi:Holliday junction DNA helicase subunit RuvA [Marinitoga hydrogenitolerans DSM 16785]|uniref:Holliday junction branch migration complex subunit RuvA n=1 Tax=Marinitoga hydrogenitolerans (strain DSM 16785 / JCM 12826 / AT1271) TaxID=1122195 RepID=A0A1M4TYF3_MARH1|nr:Holliday junction branch migration protein RuvA [Marinitoga hydrogenitolerans]SHE49528.1 Holliday junction DNA helicase subunit RuvA [Marinitoga hydrogenitolerans DSM 16785]